MTIATVDAIRKTGVAGSSTNTTLTDTSTRACTDDNPAPGNDFTIPIPSSGSNYSYWVTNRLSVVSNADGHTLDNLRFYVTTHNVPTGVTINVAKASTGSNAGYRQATGTQRQSGNQLNQTNHTGLDASPLDLFTLVAGSPLALAGSTTSTGELGDHVVWQVAVGAAASPATPAPAEGLAFRYDEA